jgi:hypothetical protein
MTVAIAAKLRRVAAASCRRQPHPHCHLVMFMCATRRRDSEPKMYASPSPLPLLTLPPSHAIASLSHLAPLPATPLPSLCFLLGRRSWVFLLGRRRGEKPGKDQDLEWACLNWRLLSRLDRFLVGSNLSSVLPPSDPDWPNRTGP